MAYKISRSRIIEDLELEGGPVLHVELDIERIANNFNIAYNKVITAEQELRKLKQDKASPDISIEKNFGEAVIELLKLVFGEEDTGEILKYYEGHYIEMATEVFPFIIEVIYPKIKAFVLEKRNKLANNYRMSKRLGRW